MSFLIKKARSEQAAALQQPGKVSSKRIGHTRCNRSFLSTLNPWRPVLEQDELEKFNVRPLTFPLKVRRYIQLQSALKLTESSRCKVHASARQPCTEENRNGWRGNYTRLEYRVEEVSLTAANKVKTNMQSQRNISRIAFTNSKFATWKHKSQNSENKSNLVVVEWVFFFF